MRDILMELVDELIQCQHIEGLSPIISEVIPHVQKIDSTGIYFGALLELKALAYGLTHWETIKPEIQDWMKQVNLVSKHGFDKNELSLFFYKLSELGVIEKQNIKNRVFVRFKTSELNPSTTKEKLSLCKQLYENVRAGHLHFDRVLEEIRENDTIIGVKWVLSSKHSERDICDTYAENDLYGMGAGCYPKDRIPSFPAHSGCLCRLNQILKPLEELLT